MPLISVTASNPTKFSTVSFVLNHSATDPLQFQCTTRSLQHVVNQSFADVKTLCNPTGEAPSTVTASLDAELLWEHSTTGTWNKLFPLAGTRVPFAVLLRGTGAPSASNPEMSGFVWVPQVPFIDGTAVDEYMYVSLSFKISGIPIFTTSGSAVYAGHTAPA